MAVVETTTRPRVRWTPSTIRKATLCPKPKGAVQAYQESIAARGEPIGRLLAHILEHADIIDDGRRLDYDGVKFTHTGAWLLTPLPADLLDQLLAIGAELADLEPSEDSEPDHDGEPSLGANEAVSQVRSWGRRPAEAYSADLEDGTDDEGLTDDDEFSSRDGLPVFAGSDDPFTHPVLGRFARL